MDFNISLKLPKQLDCIACRCILPKLNGQIRFLRRYHEIKVSKHAHNFFDVLFVRCCQIVCLRIIKTNNWQRKDYDDSQEIPVLGVGLKIGKLELLPVVKGRKVVKGKGFTGSDLCLPS